MSYRRLIFSFLLLLPLNSCNSEDYEDPYKCLVLRGEAIVCEAHLECVLAQTTCCDECNGGEQYAVNRACLEKFLGANKIECAEGEKCGDKICNPPFTARCHPDAKTCVKAQEIPLDE
jgi:hypothetical protein